MGIRYTQYTLTSTSQLIVGYQCEKCGKKQTVCRDVTTTGGYNDLFSFNLDKRSSQAKSELIRSHQQKIDAILSEMERGKYRKLDITWRCRKCGNQPPWSGFSTALMNKITRFTLIPEFILALSFFILSQESSFNPLVLLWLVPLPIIYAICRLVYEFNARSKEKEIAQLDPCNLPIFLNNEEEKREFLGTTQSNASSEPSSQQNTLQDRALQHNGEKVSAVIDRTSGMTICPNCGLKQRANRIICLQCGIQFLFSDEQENSK